MESLADYIPYCDWTRNYKAMTDENLTNAVIDFTITQKRGYVTEAVQRVMDKGGDIDDNFKAARKEARNRGITRITV